MRLSTPIYKLKRQAKLLARETGVPHHAALDEIARNHGYGSWGSLIHSQDAPDVGAMILSELYPGDLVLLGGRPGHGKTQIGFSILKSAVHRGMCGTFFTLEYTKEELFRRELLPVQDGKTAILVDASDEVSSEHIIKVLSAESGQKVAVVDYMQLLDQDRRKPELGLQIEALQAYAKASGTILILLSQIDRGFEELDKEMPDINDIRMPNPVDLGHFSRTCFLHNGEISLSAL